MDVPLQVAQQTQFEDLAGNAHELEAGEARAALPAGSWGCRMPGHVQALSTRAQAPEGATESSEIKQGPCTALV